MVTKPSFDHKQWQLALQRKASEWLLTVHKDYESWRLFRYPITRAMLPINVLLWPTKLEDGYYVGQIMEMEYMYVPF